MASRSSKRQKISHDIDADTSTDPSSIRQNRAAFLDSLTIRSISPPRVSRSGNDSPRPVAAQTNPVIVEIEDDDDVYTASESPAQSQSTRDFVTTRESTHNGSSRPQPTNLPTRNFISSPFKLMSIRDLPASQNKDTISLHDILGNPMIKEAWIFNFCFDVDWMMTHFDPDVRDMVKVKVIHGSWRKEDGNRTGIEEACRRWPNVEALKAYLPDPFGTHHSKMFVLFTHDDQAQVIIHTANMLKKDWSNMTQAVWRSPLLPRADTEDFGNLGPHGSGSKFKHDFMAYLKAYGSKTKALRGQIRSFDFNGIKGALVSSVPSRVKEDELEGEEFVWGYPSLCRILRERKQPPPSSTRPHLVCQVSSIATLPVTSLTRFFNSIFNRNDNHKLALDQVSIIYPTPSNVASSLDGYAAGGSIHTKAQSAAHLKQITNLRETLSQWTEGPSPAFRAQRHEAAPHIKTYVQYRERPTLQHPAPDIDWALLTSANLSTQAWGAFREKEKEVVVQSFEIGVLVWPGLFSEDFDSRPTIRRDEAIIPHPNDVRMVPVFGKDMPSEANVTASIGTNPTTIVGLRIPYDLPLTRYGSNELPWSPHGTYELPDRHGRMW